MRKKLRCVMLIDDDQNDNFYHQREIKKVNPNITIVTKTTGVDALEYLKSNKENIDMLPDLIYLDINMPLMNGWEFLVAYEKLDEILQSGTIIIMLSSSGNLEDITRAMAFSCVSDYITKPLTSEITGNIFKIYFN